MDEVKIDDRTRSTPRRLDASKFVTLDGHDDDGGATVDVGVGDERIASLGSRTPPNHIEIRQLCV